MLVLSCNQNEALRFRIGIGNTKTIAIKYYISDVPLPIKTKLSFTLNKSQLTTFIEKCHGCEQVFSFGELTANSVSDEDFIALLNKFSEVDEVFVTIPLTMAANSYAFSISKLTNNAPIDTIIGYRVYLGSLGIASVSQTCSYVATDYSVYINGVLVTQHDICNRCPFNEERISGFCYLKVSNVDCLLNGYIDNVVVDKDLRLAQAIVTGGVHDVLSDETESADALNNGGGIYYV